MVGSNTRKVGKTQLVCALIRKFSPHNKIIGLKITTISDKDKHHKANILDGKKFIITKETNHCSAKDTSKMLQAGAYKVFHIIALKDGLESAFKQFINQVGKNSIIICESTSLRKFVKPGIFIMLIDENSNDMKASAKEVLKFADIIVPASDNYNLDLIDLIENKWNRCF